IRQKNLKKVSILMGLFFAGAAGSWLTTQQSAISSHTSLPNVTFSCQGHRLFASSDHSSTQIATFSYAGGYSGSERCSIIRGNMQSANQTNRLNFITSGYRNGYPIICGVSSFGQSCNTGSYLFTLARRRTSPRTALLRFLYRLNTGNTDGYVLYDNDSRIYVDFSEYVGNAFAADTDSTLSEASSIAPASPIDAPSLQPGIVQPESGWSSDGVFPDEAGVF
ncbi:MAG: COP23 domain-containing protein, partial [Cyanobacteria bacterium J06632_3]